MASHRVATGRTGAIGAPRVGTADSLNAMLGGQQRRRLVLALALSLLLGPAEIDYATKLNAARLHRGEPSLLVGVLRALDRAAFKPVYALDDEHVSVAVQQLRPEQFPLDDGVAVVALSPCPSKDAASRAPKEVIGLYYFRNRYLDPEEGRFVNRDPIGVWGNAGNLGNAYAFCGGDPLNRRDPFGLEDWWNPTTWFKPTTYDNPPNASTGTKILNGLKAGFVNLGKSTVTAIGEVVLTPTKLVAPVWLGGKNLVKWGWSQTFGSGDYTWESLKAETWQEIKANFADLGDFWASPVTGPVYHLKKGWDILTGKSDESGVSYLAETTVYVGALIAIKKIGGKLAPKVPLQDDLPKIAPVPEFGGTPANGPIGPIVTIVEVTPGEYIAYAGETPFAMAQKTPNGAMNAVIDLPAAGLPKGQGYGAAALKGFIDKGCPTQWESVWEGSGTLADNYKAFKQAGNDPWATATGKALKGLGFNKVVSLKEEGTKVTVTFGKE